MHGHLFEFCRHILILKADRLWLAALRHAATVAFPAASVAFTHCVAGARTALARRRYDLLISGLLLPDGDVLDLLAGNALTPPPAAPRQLVVTGQRLPHMLAALRARGVAGAFDTRAEQPEAIASVVTRVGRGGRYWSKDLAAHAGVDSARPPPLHRLLTPVEELVLATIGDGSSDRAGAGHLGVEPSTIHGVRRELYRKLGVHDCPGLARAAQQAGYVRITPAGVIRPGYAHLFAACRGRKMGRGRSRLKSHPFAPD